jgi:glycosyltransferase involved in cell wall biosynthesis
MLSIVILTRNRREAILKTLKSCIECSLPEKVEFVVVDNASDDGTKNAVEFFFQTYFFEYQYQYLSENVGVAAGRNEGFRLSKGRYVYFIDDDAYIDGPKEFFFEKMINFLDAHEDVFCITTSIYDTAFEQLRSIRVSKDYYLGNYKKAFSFHGGSFLLDKQKWCIQDYLFLGHQFRGMQELYPSLKSYFSRRYIVYMDDLKIIHNPGESARYTNKKSILLHYAHTVQAKLILYPLVTYPIIYFMFCLRIVKHLGFKALRDAFRTVSFTNGNLRRETGSLYVFLNLLREFGLVVAF